MRKNKRKIINPISFEPEPLFPDEKWKDITNREIDGIKPWYIVSNYGRIYNWMTERFMSQTEASNHLYSHLRCERNNKSIDNHAIVHRVMKMTFDYQPGCENLEADHDDECSYNNMLPNINFVERENNIRKSFNSPNSRFYMNTSKGENHPEAIYTNEQIKEVCKLLQETNLSYPEIASLTGCTVYLVKSVKRRITWNNISKDYIWKHREEN